MPIGPDDVRRMAELLGESGVQAGLEQSHLSNAELRAIAEQMGKTVLARAKRKDLVTEIVAGATQRIDLTIDKLMEMNTDDLLVYFENKRPSRSELLKILGELDFHPGSEAQKSLYKYAARQISETGMFQRVAEKRRG